jgi:uncharacterized protein YndB with AHSA1/START domain
MRQCRRPSTAQELTMSSTSSRSGMLKTRKLELERTLPCTREEAWAWWTEPSRVEKWFAPPGFRCKLMQWYAEEDERYRVGMQGGKDTFWVSGTFDTVHEQHVLSFTWKWDHDELETLAQVTFTEGEEGGTRILLDHGGFPSRESREHHASGWVGIFTTLQRVVIAAALAD